MNQAAATRTLRRCIAQVASHRDRRGDTLAERSCAAALGGSAIDAAAAAAARRIGVWLRGVV